MKIAFDAKPLADNQKTGIGFCADGVVRALLANHPEHSYYLQFFKSRSFDIAAKLDEYRQLGAVLDECKWFYHAVYRMLWSLLPVPYSLFFGNHADITHFFNFIVPPGVHGKKVATVHDMGYKAFPETVRFKTKLLLKLSLEKSCKRADVIITDSDFSKREIIKYLNIKPEKITVVPCGVDTSHFKPSTDKQAIESAKNRYGISGKYFLYLGTLEPRKNLTRLIEAYHLLTKNMTDAPALVLAGRKGWLYDSIFERVKTLGLEDRVLFTGYAASEDIPLLLCGATAFVFPSLYEGFGMPPLEAMSCGAPVLTSNCSSLPEVVGDCAIQVDPYSTEDIAEGMRRLAEDEQLRSALSQKGLERSKQFSWERAAELTLEVYDSLMS